MAITEVKIDGRGRWSKEEEELDSGFPPQEE